MKNLSLPWLVFKAVINRDTLLSMILPAIIYFTVYKWFGLSYAVLASGGYALIISLYLKSTGIIAFAFALFGLIEILIVWLTPEQWLVDAVFLKTLLGAVQAIAVFLVFSLLNKPIPKFFAEAASPELKDLGDAFPRYYLLVWQQVSAIWITGYTLKALLLVVEYPIQEAQLVTISVVLGWPLHMLLLTASIIFARYRFQHT